MWILKTAVLLAVPVLITGQCDQANGDQPVKDKPDPFLPNGSGDAIAVWSEVTASQSQTTYVVREVYDRKADKSFLEYYDGSVFQKILLDRTNQLMYSYTDDACSTVESGRTAIFYRNTALFRALRIPDVPQQGFLGPASIFDEFSKSDVKIAQTATCETDRFVPCVQYKTCEGRTDNYWYSQNNYPLFNQTKIRPLRYRAESGLLIEVLSVKTYNTSQELFVPTGLSCQNPKDVKPVVPFDMGRHSFVGEVVMTTNKLDKFLVSKFDGLIVPPSNKKPDGNVSGIYSFTSSTFKANEDVPEGLTKIIHDVDHNIVYSLDIRDDADESALKQTKCTISPATDFQPTLSFPNYGSISLWPIFLEAPIDASDVMVSHLGANRIGAADTDVYEVTYIRTRTGNNILLNRLVVSHHFGALSGLITAVEINGFDTDESKIFSATIYINKYESRITQLNEKLRVDDCSEYQDTSESRWLEIGFEDASSGSVAQIEQSAFQIREAFIDKLQTDYGVDPMRLPQINVDFVDQQVLVTALLLERPLLDMAYKDALRRDFKKPTRVLGVMSRKACQISCLGMTETECTAISYCGATCSTSNAGIPAAPALTDNSDSCLLFERDFDRDILVSSKILRDLRSDVTTPATENILSLRFATAAGDGSSGGSQEVQITAITYDDTKNFDNAFHYDKDKVAIVETSYKLVMPKRRFKSDSKASLLGSFVLEDCALACKNRQNCEAFSFCKNSMECMISENHDISNDEVEEDNECVAYQKKYLDRFEKYPGLTTLGRGTPTTVTSEESCAQLCIQRADCKSFEFCDSNGDCLLLTSHIADAKVVETKDQKDEDAKCSHYSKRFLFDYSILPKKRGNGDHTTELASYTNITQAACAKLCSEWGSNNSTCLSFDFCAAMPDNTGVCTLRTVDGKAPTESPICNFLYLTVPPSLGVVKHGSGEAIGLSILMMLIGAGLAVGGLFLYTKYR